MMSQQHTETANIIAQLITDRNWFLVHKALHKHKHLSHSFHASKCCNDCSQAHNILHFALQHNAPFNIIQCLIRQNPKLVYEINCMGHFPLQTALMHGTFPPIVTCLLKKNKKAAEVLDVEGKTCLHLAFDVYENLTRNNDPVTRKIFEYLPKVIRLVCSLNPSNVSKEDKNGMNVLKYAMEKDAGDSIIIMLHEIIMDDNKKSMHPCCENNSNKSAESNESQKIKIKSSRRLVRKCSTNRIA